MGDIEQLKKEIKKIKFLHNAIVHNGKRARVHYSQGSYIPESKIPKGTITVYAKDYGSQLPKELNPKNETDFMTDYFDTDTVRITPESKHFKAVLKALEKHNAFEQKWALRTSERRKKKYPHLYGGL